MSHATVLVVVGLAVVAILIVVLAVMTLRRGLQTSAPSVPAIYGGAIAVTFAVLALMARHWPDLGFWWIAVAILPVVWFRAVMGVRARRS